MRPAQSPRCLPTPCPPTGLSIPHKGHSDSVPPDVENNNTGELLTPLSTRSQVPFVSRSHRLCPRIHLERGGASPAPCLTLDQVPVGARLRQPMVSPLLSLLPRLTSQVRSPGCFCQNIGQTMSHFSFQNLQQFPISEEKPTLPHNAPHPALLPHIPGPLPDLPLLCSRHTGHTTASGFLHLLSVSSPNTHPLDSASHLLPISTHKLLSQ